MQVRILDDEDVLVCRIYITKYNDNAYEYLIDTEEQGSEGEGMIFNHVGDYLELLEKILHGRNMSRENQVQT